MSHETSAREQEIKRAFEPIRTRVGEIVQLSQQFELGLKYAISLVKELEGDAEDDSVFDTEFESLSRKTLGQLIPRFRKHIELDSAAENILATAVADRNCIIHKFFTDRVEELATPEGRVSGLRYLANALNSIESGFLEVHKVVPKLMAASGLSPAEIETAARKAFKP